MTLMNNTSGSPPLPEKTNRSRGKLGALILSDDSSSPDDYYSARRNSDATNSTRSSQNQNFPMNYHYYSNPSSANSSPYIGANSPWSQPSPYTKSPWIHILPEEDEENDSKFGLIGSLFREEAGHIYSVAISGDLLFTGSDSKNIRVWRNLGEFSGFKSSSGLVKTIVVYRENIFTGHQDGKIRAWRFPSGKSNSFKRVGNLPTTRDLLRNSINPRNYVETRRKHNVPWIKHYDAVSCMTVDNHQGLLYSGSWDKTVKVWRISDMKCLESINAHDDAVNSVVTGFSGLVFTGSADGSVKSWRRELIGKCTKHVLVDTLLSGDHAVTCLAVGAEYSSECLYAGSSDGLVRFWTRGKHGMSYGGVLRGHKLAVLCVAVGGGLVVSGSADRSICVWRREVGGVHACVAVLTGHAGPVKCLAMQKETEEEEEEEERWVVYSGSLDKSVKIWRVSERGPMLEEEEEE